MKSNTNKKGINIPAPIVPYTDKDVYPTHEAIYGKGGWKSVNTIDDLKAIPEERLENGCIVRVINSSSGSAVEFYYDDKIKLGSSAPSSITDPIEREVYPYRFRKWTPGYLPTKLSDLENDEYFISEVHGTNTTGDYVYLDPNSSDNSKIEEILINRPRGIYQELALAFLNKNSRTTVKVDTNEDGTVNGEDNSIPIHGLVTVDDSGKIPNNLLEYPGKYVESVVAMFPDDYCEDPLDPSAWWDDVMDENTGITTRMKVGTGKYRPSNHPNALQSPALNWPQPEVTEYLQKYYITEYFMYNDSSDVSNKYRNKVATVTSSDNEKFSWTAVTPIFNDIIYVDEFRRTAFIVKDEGLIVEKSIGRDLIRTIEELTRPANIEQVPTEWDNWGISAKVAYQILLEMDRAVAWKDAISAEEKERKSADAELNARIDDLWNRLNAHIQNKNNPHQVTRKQLGIDVDDEVVFSKVYAKEFYMSSGGLSARSSIASTSINSENNSINVGETSVTRETNYSSIISQNSKSAAVLSTGSPTLRVGPVGGKYEWDDDLDAERQERENEDKKIRLRIDEIEGVINAHIARRDNPHKTNRSHLKVDVTDSVMFSKIDAPNGFFQKSGVAAVFKLADESSFSEEIEESKLNLLETKIKELENELAELKKK